MIIFHPEYYFPDKARQQALTEAAEQRLETIWSILEQEYRQQTTDAPWMFASGPTAVDFALATVLLWPECFPPTSQAYPSLAMMLQTLSDRASFKRIMPWHQGMTDDPPHRTNSNS